MADDDVIDLNALIDQRLNLFNKANQTFLTKPTIGAGAARGSQLIANDLYRSALGLPEIEGGQVDPNILDMGAGMPPEMAGQAAQEIKAEIAERGITPSFEEVLRANNISNAGAPMSIRAKTGYYNFDDPKLYKAQVEEGLKNYFIEEGLITNKFDFGLRIGPVSQRLEFRDPRRGGQYTVVDPVGGVDTFTGDLLDLTGEAGTIVGEVGAAMLALPTVPYAGPIGPIASSSVAAFGTTYTRLIEGYLRGELPEQITHQDIIQKAMTDARWSLLGGAGGALAFKIARPLYLKAIGKQELPSGLEEIDGDLFNKAHKAYLESDEAKLAKQLGIKPTSAQVAEIGAQKLQQFTTKDNVLREKFSGLESARLKNLASELAAQEAKVAKDPSLIKAGAVLDPIGENIITGKEAINKAFKEGFPEGMDDEYIKTLNGVKNAKTGDKILQELDKIELASQQNIKLNYANKLNELDAEITEGLNLPSDIKGRTEVGVILKDTLQSYSNKGFETLQNQYDELFETWAKTAGVNLNDVVTGIKPTQAVAKANRLLTSLKNSPLASQYEGDIRTIQGIIDSFEIGGKGAAKKIKDVSLNDLNKFVLQLRELERKVFKQARSGSNDSSVRTINELTTIFEQERDRILKKFDKKGIDIVTQLRDLDDNYTDFINQVSKKEVSTIKQILNTDDPKQAFKLIVKPNRGDTNTIANILKKPEHGEILYDIRNLLLKEYEEKVIKRDATTGLLTGVNVNASNKFRDTYEQVLEQYFPKMFTGDIVNNPQKFAAKIQELTDKRNMTLRNLNERINIQSRNPDDVFKATWEGGEDLRITNFDKILPILNEDIVLKDAYKGLVFTDMMKKLGKPKLINGIEVPDPDNLLEYIRTHRDRLNSLFSDNPNYVSDLEKITEVVKNVAFITPKTRGAFQEQDALTGFVRAYLGVFTRPGRAVTAVNILRKKAGRDALPNLLMNPEKLRQAINLSKVTNLEKISSAQLGRIFFDYTGSIDDFEVTDKQPSATKALVEQSKLEKFGPEVMFPELTEKALQLDYDF